MTDTYRALCAELADDLEPWITYGEIEAIEKSHDLIDRARAALAAEPAPPADGEVAEPPEAPIWLNNAEAAAWQSGWASAAADFLELLAPQPVPEGPTNQDIEALHQAVFAGRLQGPPPNTSFEVDLVRAALARWGQP